MDGENNTDIIVILLDSVRAASTPIHGYHKDITPNIERFAEEGIVYEQARSPSNWTIPSFTSMLTGVPTHQHQMTESTKLETSETFLTSDPFDSYETSFITGMNSLTAPELGIGACFDITYDCNFTDETFEMVIRDTIQSTENNFSVIHVPPIDVNAVFHQKMQTLIENYSDTNVTTTTEMWDVDALLDHSPDWWLEEIQDIYDEFVQSMDEVFGQILSILRDIEQYEQSRIVVTSTHGAGMGEVSGIPNAPRAIGTGLTLHEQNVHVPLVSKPPGAERADRVVHPVSLTSFKQIALGHDPQISQGIITSVSQHPPMKKQDYIKEKTNDTRLLEPWRSAYIPDPAPSGGVLKYSRWNGFAAEQRLVNPASYTPGTPINPDVVDGLFTEENSNIARPQTR